MFQNKNFYQPLIATSLALSLCSIQAREITGSTDLTLTQISDISSISDGKVGLYLNSTSSKNDFVLKLIDNVTIEPVISDANAYGILVRTSSLTQFLSTNFQTILVQNVSGAEGKEAYAYKNLSTKNVQFLSTGIVAGSQDEGNCTFGVFNNLNGAKYDFGSSTYFSANSQGQGSVDGANAYGVVIKQDATFEGNLSFSSIRAGNIGGTGKKAGDAIGIKGSNNAALRLEGSNISFTLLQAGVNIQGKNGEVIGIYTDGDFSIISSAGKSGKIDLSSLSITQDAFIVKNSGTGTLTLSSGVDIVYDAKGTSITNAVITDTIGGKYSFGSGST